MPRYLDPKADVVFKKIFADHPHILISFLNAVLPLPSDSPIVSLTYLPAEQVPDIPDFKRTSGEKKLRLLWLRFLREIDEKTREVPKELLQVPEIAEAIELSEEAAYTPEQLESYQSYWDAVSREKTLINETYTKGRAEGKEEGKREIALNLKKTGMSLEMIAKITGLSLEELHGMGGES